MSFIKRKETRQGWDKNHYIFGNYHSGKIYRGGCRKFMVECACEDAVSRGVWGHAPPGKFRSSEINPGAFWGKNGVLHG